MFLRSCIRLFMPITITETEDTIYIHIKQSSYDEYEFVGEKECLHVEAFLLYVGKAGGPNLHCDYPCLVSFTIKNLRNGELLFKKDFLLTETIACGLSDCPGMYFPEYFYDKYGLFKNFSAKFFECDRWSINGVTYLTYCVEATLELYNKSI